MNSNPDPLFARIARAPLRPRRVFNAFVWHFFSKRRLDRANRRREIDERARQYPTIRVNGPDRENGPLALLNFVVEPFLDEPDEATLKSHANYSQAVSVVDALNGLGFNVDITEWRNQNAPNANGYDVVLGLGNAFSSSCIDSHKNIPRIYFGWGLYSGATQDAIQRRSVDFQRRTGNQIAQRHPDDFGPKYATDIVFLGNEYVRRTYESVSNAITHQLRNPITPGVASTLEKKDFDACRRRFLWMAGYGTLRRSLDVLLEIFHRNPEYELWICGDISHEKTFFSYYHDQLHACENIKYLGWVDVTGEEYRKATRNCGYILYPSVSDGMPGSVVNAMASGLIPIVTEAAGMECAGLEIAIPKIEHQIILRIMEEAAVVTPEAMKQRANDVHKFATEFYSQGAFRTSFAAALENALSRQGILNGS